MRLALPLSSMPAHSTTKSTKRGIVPFVVKTVFVALVVSGAFVVARAYERSLDAVQINQAIRIGTSSSAADRARFHRPYRLPINRAPFDWIDVITPFRRVALGAESHTRDGGRLYGQ